MVEGRSIIKRNSDGKYRYFFVLIYIDILTKNIDNIAMYQYFLPSADNFFWFLAAAANFYIGGVQYQWQRGPMERHLDKRR